MVYPQTPHPVEAELYLGSSMGWVDISGDLRAATAASGGSVTITRGRQAEGGQVDAGRCTLVLNNRLGKYSPRNPLSDYYGLLGRNTPVRVGLTLAVETFGGTSSSGWTPTDTGQVWINTGAAAADFTESGGVGRHLQPLKNIVRVSTLSGDWRDVEQVTTASIPAVALGASAVVGHVARRQANGDYYWLRLEFDTGGKITAKISKWTGGGTSLVELASASAIAGLTYTAGQGWNLRSSVSGHRLAIKIWQDGTPEPVAWTLETADQSIPAAGKAGLASWVVGGNTNTTEIRFDNYRAVLRRFFGEVSSWPQRWDVSGADQWVPVEAGGILRRLRQGTPPALSPLRRTIGASKPVSYWPAEDGVSAGQAGSGLAGTPPLVASGTVNFQSSTDYNSSTLQFGTSKLGDLSGGGTLSANLSGDATAATQSAWTVHVFGRFDVAFSSGDIVLMEWTTGGTYVRWQLVESKTTLHTQVIAYNSAGTATVVVDRNGVLGGFRTWVVSAQQVGGNINVTYRVAAAETYTGSVAGTLGGVVSMTVNPSRTTSTQTMPFGHLAVWASATLPYGTDVTLDSYGGVVNPPYASYLGEAAHIRLARLAAEAGIPLTMAPVSDEGNIVRMGWQQPASTADLMAECAEADGGLLYEARDQLGLVYRRRDSLYNQTPVTVDYAAGQISAPFEPVDDDDQTRNDITVSRRDGASARATQTTGPLAALDPPGGVGVYQDSVTLNLGEDTLLADLASWRLHLGTVDESRYPRIHVDLTAPGWTAVPDLAVQVAALDSGDVVAVAGLPAWLPPGPVKTMIQGYTETLDGFDWDIVWNATPASPWDVATVDGPQRVAADGTVLNTAIPNGTWGSFELKSTAANGPWTTNAADFPLLVRVGGEVMQVSTIGGTGLVQTAIVAQRGVNGVAKAWPAGTEVDVWQPAIAAL